MKVLVLNRGSSTLKSFLYELGTTLPNDPPEPRWEALVDWTHVKDGVEVEITTAASGPNRNTVRKIVPAQAPHETIALMLQSLWSGPTQVISRKEEIDCVGHRVVHGGSEYVQSVIVDSNVKAAISRYAEFAPVHNPLNLEGIEAVEAVFGNKISQVAVFDTAFHAPLKQAAYVYPGLYEWLEQGIRRYGFHGISNQYCARRAAEILGRAKNNLRLITCHLGNGSSVTAVRNGLSVDTTMGFTPLEGVMMGTRSGSVDPGVLIHLLRQPGFDANKLDELLNKKSGLLGLSGVSGDLRQVAEAIRNGNARAQLAVDVFIHRLSAGIGAMIASLGGTDALIFTAGIGEHSAYVREKVCESFEFLGLKLDAKKNQAKPDDEDISAADSKVKVLVIHTQEDWEIARECWLVRQKG